MAEPNSEILRCLESVLANNSPLTDKKLSELMASNSITNFATELNYLLNETKTVTYYPSSGSYRYNG